MAQIEKIAISTYFIMESESWFHVCVRDKAIEFVILLLGDAFCVHQPKRLQLIYLLFIQIDRMADEVTVFLDDSCENVIRHLYLFNDQTNLRWNFCCLILIGNNKRLEIINDSNR